MIPNHAKETQKNYGKKNYRSPRDKKPKVLRFTSVEPCPTCGEEIQVAIGVGEIRSCKYCKRRFTVVSEFKRRKTLEACKKEEA